jgi:hypothetical protein
MLVSEQRPISCVLYQGGGQMLVSEQGPIFCVLKQGGGQMLVSEQAPIFCVLKQGGGQMKPNSPVCPVCSSGAVENEKHFIFECPPHDEILFKIRFSRLFRGPRFPSSVLQENSPLV